MKNYDVAIIGAGAAGLTAAACATARGRRTLVLDMGRTPARKVEVSGGGRCNFTNTAASRDKYFGKNPDFVRGALARVRPCDMLDWAAAHGIQYVQKATGQYFCDGRGADVVAALLQDADGADIQMMATVQNAVRNDGKFIIKSDKGDFTSDSLIIATGGISFSNLGVSDIGYKIAKSFGHKIIPPRPALCAIDTDVFPHEWAGISMPVALRINGRNICGDMLFTHFGIGGPAIYSASVADAEHDIHINLIPDTDVAQWLRTAKRTTGRKLLSTVLAERMPAQIARHFAGTPRNIADFRDEDLKKLAAKITDVVLNGGRWRHHGMTAAEVTFGGVDTSGISSKTMESKICPGLFFAGEVMDITGDLGGFNLHWAWASGRVAGENA